MQQILNSILFIKILNLIQTHDPFFFYKERVKFSEAEIPKLEIPLTKISLFPMAIEKCWEP